METTKLWLWTLMHEGGWVMWILLALSIACIATAIERAVFLHRIRHDSDELIRRLAGALFRQRSVARALELAQESDAPPARLAAAILRHFERSPAQLEKSIERRAAREQRRLTRGLGILASIATLAPLLGFLGTVTGMMSGFEVLADRGLSDPAAVARGIKEALTTTAAGLVVAVPAQLLHNVLAGRIARIEGDLEAVANFLLEARGEAAERAG